MIRRYCYPRAATGTGTRNGFGFPVPVVIGTGTGMVNYEISNFLNEIINKNINFFKILIYISIYSIYI